MFNIDRKRNRYHWIGRNDSRQKRDIILFKGYKHHDITERHTRPKTRANYPR